MAMAAKVFLLIVLSACLAAALPVEDKIYSRFIEFPDRDEVAHTVDLEDEIDEDLLEEIKNNPADNGYYLYTRQNVAVPQQLEIDDPDTIRKSNFDVRNPTVVIAHGWLSNEESNLNPTIRDAFFGRGDYNIITLDWRRLARKNYITAARGVPDIGRGLGMFLALLQQVTGVSYENIHLVGFSLGAHLVGSTGRYLGGRIGRITALDPAGPLWTFSSDKVKETDAIYVEGIHTNGGIIGLGIGTAIGHADFFPNGGNSQSGCLTPICDHNRAWRLFAATVTYEHLVGRECETLLQITVGICRGERLVLGNGDVRKYGRGRYLVSTSWRYPY